MFMSMILFFDTSEVRHGSQRRQYGDVHEKHVITFSSDVMLQFEECSGFFGYAFSPALCGVGPDKEALLHSTCAGVFDPYIPPEGDSRLSSLSKEGLKQRTEQIRQSAASQLAVRKIKEHDTTFTTKEFPGHAQGIYIEAHNALTQFNKEKLHSLVTERCYPEMTRANRYKTLRWTFVESLEPPKVVHARCPEMVSKGNLYGQVTLRIHSRQTLAIYDRFGRLMLGSEEEPKDVLEYLVLERHLINPYGRWRLHGKIVPAWAPAKDPIIKTVMIPGPELKPGEEFEALNFEVPKPKAIQWHK
ncbi:39S ribosomal protein L45, mitochondrial isoform X1 [Osmerus mordax]|uniref:39S ribosomal protein L45, mitochondrial isoform X1 n=1 Tax=Osmerus mordax TaxID=8014 RepID=UPI003510BE73